jgi:hypothetical protein
VLKRLCIVRANVEPNPRRLSSDHVQQVREEAVAKDQVGDIWRAMGQDAFGFIAIQVNGAVRVPKIFE